MNQTVDIEPVIDCVNAEMGIPETLTDMPAGSYTLELIDYQNISMCIASFVGVCSMIYGVFCAYIMQKGLTFHFIGIRRPKAFGESTYELFDNINTKTMMITVESHLSTNDTIYDLKQLIRKLYGIPQSNDILILYAHHVVSSDDKLKLMDCGITNNALLTLAICDTAKHEDFMEQFAEDTKTPDTKKQSIDIDQIETEERAKIINQLFEMNQEDEDEDDVKVESESKTEADEETDKKETDEDDDYKEELEYKDRVKSIKGFDIITQEDNVDVFEMPNCRHLMNKDSLYHYALNTFKESTNLNIKCPHMDNKCRSRWNYSLISHVLKQTDENKWLDFARLELLASRNRIESKCDVQRCPQCKTLYFRVLDPNKDTKKPAQSIKREDVEKEFRTECILCNNGTTPVRYYEKWRVGKSCEIYSRSRSLRTWVKCKVVKSYTNDKGEGMLTVKFCDEEKTKDIEQDSEFVRKINDANKLDDAAFCWCCGEQWADNHFCDSSFLYELIEILSQAETKQIGSVKDVPSIRCCPFCAQLITHVEACKHMRCSRCAQSFCFVCMVPQKNGSWQCGSSGDPCPVAARQTISDLPDCMMISKKSFALYPN